MSLSNRFIIEDEQGNKLYPHTFAQVVSLNDGTNVEQAIIDLKTQLGNLNFSWESITGKPTSFPPSTHAHDKIESGSSNANFVNGLLTISSAYGNMQMGVDGSGIGVVKSSASRINFATDLQEKGQRVYSPNNKPTSADVGLGNVPNYGASNSVTSASNTTFATSGAVKTAYDRAEQAFQSASSGKTSIANAITAKGVSASSADTFSTLATKIGLIGISIPTSAMSAKGHVATPPTNTNLILEGVVKHNYDWNGLSQNVGELFVSYSLAKYWVSTGSQFSYTCTNDVSDGLLVSIEGGAWQPLHKTNCNVKTRQNFTIYNPNRTIVKLTCASGVKSSFLCFTWIE